MTYVHFLIGRERSKQRMNTKAAEGLACSLRLANFHATDISHIADALSWQRSGDVIIETDNSMRYYSRPRDTSYNIAEGIA